METGEKMKNMTIEQFAAIAPIGTPCTYYPVKPFRVDEALHTRIRSEPWELGHGQIVVKIEGKAGGVAIEHLVLASLTQEPASDV